MPENRMPVSHELSTHKNPKQYLNSTFHGGWSVHALLPLLRGCILRLDKEKKEKSYIWMKSTMPLAL